MLSDLGAQAGGCPGSGGPNLRSEHLFVGKMQTRLYRKSLLIQTPARLPTASSISLGIL